MDAWESETGRGAEPVRFGLEYGDADAERGAGRTIVEYKAAQGLVVDPDDVDLDGRTTTEFENFWQDALDDVAYGQEHAAYILESFASYAEAGADAASVYGVDLIHPGRLVLARGWAGSPLCRRGYAGHDL